MGLTQNMNYEKQNGFIIKVQKKDYKMTRIKSKAIWEA